MNVRCCMSAQRCFRCGLINPATATRCDCGYVFGSEREVLVADDLRRLIRDGWIMVLVGLVLMIGVGGLTVLLVVSGSRVIVYWLAPIVVGAGLVGRGVHRIVSLRGPLRELEGKTDRIPQARVEKR